MALLLSESGTSWLLATDAHREGDGTRRGLSPAYPPSWRADGDVGRVKASGAWLRPRSAHLQTGSTPGQRWGRGRGRGNRRPVTLGPPTSIRAGRKLTLRRKLSLAEPWIRCCEPPCSRGAPPPNRIVWRRPCPGAVKLGETRASRGIPRHHRSAGPVAPAPLVTFERRPSCAATLAAGPVPTREGSQRPPAEPLRSLPHGGCHRHGPPLSATRRKTGAPRSLSTTPMLVPRAATFHVKHGSRSQTSRCFT